MEFPWLLYDERVIIAMKGLPCIGKSDMATQIGEWARCSVLYIDDFLRTLSLEKGYSSEFMPSEEEAQRLHRLAFNGLCKSAYRYLNYYERRVVVIKSRLCSTFELDSLLQLSREDGVGSVIILIIECHTKNEHRLCARLEYYAKSIREHDREWHKPRSRLDYEKARDDWLNNAQPNWDLHLCNLINADEWRPARVIRLVLDPFNDLNLACTAGSNLTPAFRDTISYLITRQHGARGEKWGEEIIRDRYEVVQLDKLQRFQVEKELRSSTSTSREKSLYLCPTTRVGKCCVVKTCTKEELLHQATERGDGDDYKCGVCEERVVSARGYTCYFCILTLHKSCAEYEGVNFSDFTRIVWLDYYPKYCDRYLPRTYACKSCTGRGKHFSNGCDACLFQTHLKCGMFPTVINHDSHHHFLSLQVGETSWSSICKACRSSLYTGKYGCYLCGLYYCLRCVSRPGEVEDNHGGHEHVMKLVYSRDGMDPKEDYWCGVCYEDMDPQLWFYSCQDCPCYQAHAHCIMPV